MRSPRAGDGGEAAPPDARLPRAALRWGGRRGAVARVEHSQSHFCSLRPTLDRLRCDHRLCAIVRGMVGVRVLL